MLGSFLNFTFSLQLHHFSMPISGFIASDGEPNFSAESQPDGQRTFQEHCHALTLPREMEKAVFLRL